MSAIAIIISKEIERTPRFFLFMIWIIHNVKLNYIYTRHFTPECSL